MDRVEVVDDLLQELVKSPRPSKLFDQMSLEGLLGDLPNVHVSETKQTHMDRDTKLGRWKVIEAELQDERLTNSHQVDLE